MKSQLEIIKEYFKTVNRAAFCREYGLSNVTLTRFLNGEFQQGLVNDRVVNAITKHAKSQTVLAAEASQVHEIIKKKKEELKKM